MIAASLRRSPSSLETPAAWRSERLAAGKKESTGELVEQRECGKQPEGGAEQRAGWLRQGTTECRGIGAAGVVGHHQTGGSRGLFFFPS